MSVSIHVCIYLYDLKRTHTRAHACACALTKKVISFIDIFLGYVTCGETVRPCKVEYNMADESGEGSNGGDRVQAPTLFLSLLLYLTLSYTHTHTHTLTDINAQTYS